jgi:hypothetical protein
MRMAKPRQFREHATDQDPSEVLLTYIFGGGYPWKAELGKVMALRDRDRGEAALLRRVVVPAAKQYKLELGSMTDRWDKLFPKDAQREVAAALYEEGHRHQDFDARYGIRENPGGLQPNHHHTILNGLAEDHQLLTQLIEMAAESMEYGSIDVRHVPDEVRRAAAEYDSELAAALDEVVRTVPPAGGADADDLWDAEAPYIVLMTLRGEGVGIWDGRWDRFYTDREIKRVEAILERRLRRFADDTGSGSLEEAFMNAASEIAGDPDYAPNAYRPQRGPGIDHDLAAERQHARLRRGAQRRVAPTTWTYEGYWNTVLGADRDAATVAREFALDTSDSGGLDEWLGHAESAAWIEGAEGRDGAPHPTEWAGFHARALAELVAVSAEQFGVGDRVVGGDTDEDYDTGRVVAVDGDQVEVAWDGSNERTTQSAHTLRFARNPGRRTYFLLGRGHGRSAETFTNYRKAVAAAKHLAKSRGTTVDIYSDDDDGEHIEAVVKPHGSVVTDF